MCGDSWHVLRQLSYVVTAGMWVDGGCSGGGGPGDTAGAYRQGPPSHHVRPQPIST